MEKFSVTLRFLLVAVVLLVCGLPASRGDGQESYQHKSSRIQTGRIGTPEILKGGSTEPGQVSMPEVHQDSAVRPVSLAPDFGSEARLEYRVEQTQEEQLQLADVIANVYRSFPVVEQARLERERTNGLITEAFGAYDTKLQGYTLSEPTGFYRNYRHGIGFARQTWWGTYLSTGYRIGRGEFQPWYKERETEKGGEFKIGLGIPLLQGRAIDAQRLAVFQANLDREAADPFIQLTILNASREASEIYWSWVGAGAVLQSQIRLLQLALDRQERFERGVEAGGVPEIDLILNQQLVAERRGKVIEARQKFYSAAFKLSLFVRDENGDPLVPNAEWVPLHFPQIDGLMDRNFQQDLQAALERRPEPRQIEFDLQQARLDLQWACNQRLPRLDAIAEASQDLGDPASSTNDKGRFQMVVGLEGEVPIQRRKAIGKIQSTQAKISQLNQKSRFMTDKIGTELQVAFNELELSGQLVAQQKIAFETALETLSRYRSAFSEGSEKVNLIDLNQVETKANEVELKLIESEQKWLIALANMQAVLGLDPLEQSIVLADAPDSIRPEEDMSDSVPEEN